MNTENKNHYVPTVLSDKDTTRKMLKELSSSELVMLVMLDNEADPTTGVCAISVRGMKERLGGRGNISDFAARIARLVELGYLEIISKGNFNIDKQPSVYRVLRPANNTDK